MLKKEHSALSLKFAFINYFVMSVILYISSLNYCNVL